MEFEIKNTIPFTLAPSKVKYLGMNLTKYVQGLKEESYKILMKEIKEVNKWREIPCSWIGRLNIVKVSVLPNLIYRFNATLIKVPASYFVNTNKLTLKFICRRERPRMANTILKEKNKVGGLTLPSLKT